MDPRMDILMATANKFYPAASNIKTTLLPNPQISLTIKGIICVVSVPSATALDHFEEEVWFGFRNLRERVTTNDVDARPVGNIHVRSDDLKVRTKVDPKTEIASIPRA